MVMIVGLAVEMACEVGEAVQGLGGRERAVEAEERCRDSGAVEAAAKGVAARAPGMLLAC